MVFVTDKTPQGATGSRASRSGALGFGVLMAIGAGLGLSGCASVTPMPEALASPGPHPYVAVQAPSTPRRSYAQAQGGARPKIGAPYQAGGVWYVPANQPDYNEVGIASWYGDQFNGKPTANGELFNMNAVSGAHATLPLPSIVEVTNLENGRSIQVRLNDRGPFHPGRIIDMSRGAATELGFIGKGTAQVRVRYVGPAPLGGANATTTIATNRMHDMLPPMPRMPMAPLEAEGGGPAAPMAAPVFAAPVFAASGYAVQAGAFSDRVNADRAVAKLANAGRATVSPLDRNGSRLYRVTLGPWANADDASAARAHIASMGFVDARIVAGS